MVFMRGKRRCEKTGVSLKGHVYTVHLYRAEVMLPAGVVRKEVDCRYVNLRSRNCQSTIIRRPTRSKAINATFLGIDYSAVAKGKHDLRSFRET